MMQPHVKYLAFAILFNVVACSTEPPALTYSSGSNADADSNYKGGKTGDVKNNTGNQGGVVNNTTKIGDKVVTPDGGGGNAPVLGGVISGGGVFGGGRPLPLPEEDDEFSFVNPIIPSRADPSIAQRDGFYYYCFAVGDSIFVSRATRIQDLGKATSERVFQVPPDQPFSKTVIVPQLQFINNRWYIYFSADDGDFANHRIFALESRSTDPQGEYTFKGKVAAFNDRHAVNASTVRINGQLFMLWSGADNGRIDQQNIYIAPMVNPFSLNQKPAFVQRVEAENSVITDARAVPKPDSSNGSNVGFIDLGTSSVEFTVTAPAAGTFAMDIAHTRGLPETASHRLLVNGRAVEVVSYPIGDDFNRVQTVTRLVTLRAGTNKIKLQRVEGSAELDYIEVKTRNVDRVAIAHPEFDFERIGGLPYANEGPIALQRNGKTFIIYSANGATSEDRSLGMMELVGADPMRKESWKKSPEAVFAKTDNVFGPGNAVFVKSPDGTEDWMVYHHQKTRGSGFDRDISMQRYEFDENGRPVFGIPVDPFDRLPIPSE